MNIKIRPIKIEDTHNIVQWRNKDFVRKNFIDQVILTEEKHINYFKEKILSKKIYQFIIVCDDNDIGTVFLRDINLETKTAEFGIFIGKKEYLGKGIGKIAVSLILEFAYNTLGINTVLLRVLKRNQRAIKSYLKSGFKIIDRTENVSINNIKEKIIFMEISK